MSRREADRPTLPRKGTAAHSSFGLFALTTLLGVAASTQGAKAELVCPPVLYKGSTPWKVDPGSSRETVFPSKEHFQACSYSPGFSPGGSRVLEVYWVEDPQSDAARQYRYELDTGTYKDYVTEQYSDQAGVSAKVRVKTTWVSTTHMARLNLVTRYAGEFTWAASLRGAESVLAQAVARAARFDGSVSGASAGGSTASATGSTTAVGSGGDSVFGGALASYNRGDYAAAAAPMQQAAEAGNIQAQRFIGHMYRNGLGVERDFNRAVAWFRKLADGGDAFAAAQLGVLYELGQGVPSDPALAVAWYRKGAEAGNTSAVYNLGRVYQMGLGGVARDDARALEFYLQADRLGYELAARDVGWMHQNGFGTAADDAEALRWYRRGADRGDARAMSDVGYFMQTARGGLPVDPAGSVQWYHRSAEAGFPGAMSSLGWAYETGFGVAVDRASSLFWYRKAAALDWQTAIDSLRRLGVDP